LKSDLGIKVSVFQKLQIMFNFIPNRQIERFIKKGKKKLNDDLDFLYLVKKQKFHHHHAKQVSNYNDHENESINIDFSSESETERRDI
jgi:hypothetical protein